MVTHEKTCHSLPTSTSHPYNDGTEHAGVSPARLLLGLNFVLLRQPDFDMGGFWALQAIKNVVHLAGVKQDGG